MRTPSIAALALFVLVASTYSPSARAQSVLLSEGFHNGALPAGWVHHSGGDNPTCSGVEFSDVGLFGSSLNLASNDPAGCLQATGVQSVETDISGCATLGLTGWFVDLGDGTDHCPATWDASTTPDGDCIGFSFDGTNFELLRELVDEPEDTQIIIAEVFSNPGETSLWLYFAELGTLPVPDEGLAFDDLVLYCDPPATELDCGDGLDDDVDGNTDCGDDDCLGDPACVGGNETCDNGIDDDGDGDTDCDDPDCFFHPSCLGGETCDNGVDDDGDGFVDCDDQDCDIHPVCTGASENCGNNMDDDGDQLIDCDDDDCWFEPSCIGGEDCGNGVDDDGDGDADCDDVECWIDPSCFGGEVCDNNVDDDGDGWVDCDDVECTFDPFCLPIGELCNNNVDDDGDGLVDCDDDECDQDPACGGGGGEICDNGVDDDVDGAIDCDDPDCTFEQPYIDVDGNKEGQR